MLTLIIGGSGSGKSAYAEHYIDMVSQGKKKYYLATMKVFDAEGNKKKERHQRLRAGKGFVTIEQPCSIEEALQKMESGEKTALLECMSNLTANEMFGNETGQDADRAADRIIKGITRLQENISDLVIVTNNVFEDGIIYDGSTMEYIRALGRINQQLAHLADEVIEVVVGIPLTVKKEKRVKEKQKKG